MTHPTPEPADLELVLDAAQEWADEYGGWDSVRCDAVTAAAKRIRALSAPPAPSRTADLTATMAGVLFRPGHRIAIISAETGEVLTWRRLGDATIGPATAGVARIEPALECRAEFTGYVQVVILDEAGEILYRGPRYVVAPSDIVTVGGVALEVLTQ